MHVVAAAVARGAAAARRAAAAPRPRCLLLNALLPGNHPSSPGGAEATHLSLCLGAGNVLMQATAFRHRVRVELYPERDLSRRPPTPEQ
jgi:hypothetical protein